MQMGPEPQILGHSWSHEVGMYIAGGIYRVGMYVAGGIYRVGMCIADGIYRVGMCVADGIYRVGMCVAHIADGQSHASQHLWR